MRSVFFLMLIASILYSCKNESMQADLIITGGKVYTLNETQPEAEALAVADGEIIAIGSNEEILRYAKNAGKHIELNGEMVIPGLIEGHGHFLNMGYSLMELNLLDTRSYQEIIDSVRERINKTQEGQWLKGRGWHQEKWDKAPGKTIKGFPTNEMLNVVSPNNPVILHHASGHAILVNDKALEMANITDDTPDPAGGKIVRDETGKATGILEENAEDLVVDIYNKYLENRSEEEKQAEFQKVMKLAEENCLKHGITAFHDAASTIEEIDQIKTYHRDTGLNVRLSLMIYEPLENLEGYVQQNAPYEDDQKFLFINSIKQFYDGALGSRGALLLEPYSDDPGNRGHLTLDTNKYEQICNIAATQGYQLCTHAIGDSANREVLDYYEKTFANHPNAQNLRWRIEHAQHLHPSDIPRFAELNVIPSMQSIHCTSDAPYVEERLGKKRAENGAYVWKTLIKSGATVMEGTDVPVERIDPFANYYSAVTRKTRDGWAFYPEQAKSREEALKGYTINNAYGMQMNEWKGTLEKGKVADITILDTDLLNCEEQDIPNTKAIYTIIDGKIVYSQ